MQTASEFEVWAGKWLFEMSAEEEAKLREEYKRIQDEFISNTD